MPSSYRNPSIQVTLRGGVSCDGVTSTLTLDYNYDISDFFAGGGATIEHTEATNGNYVIVDGRYKTYNYRDYEPYTDVPKPTRYNLDIKNAAGKTLEQYFQETVYPALANSTEIRLDADNFPSGKLTGAENPRKVNVTRFKAPIQHDPQKPAKLPDEKSEYLRIQCSSNTIDNINILNQKLSVKRLGLANVGTLSEIEATGCIDTVSKALAKVSSVRSLFGAYQNRLERAYAINRNTHENTQGAESEIRDADMADEIVKFSNQNILQQSANAMLAQANQVNQGVLALLR